MLKEMTMKSDVLHVGLIEYWEEGDKILLNGEWETIQTIKRSTILPTHFHVKFRGRWHGTHIKAGYRVAGYTPVLQD